MASCDSTNGVRLLQRYSRPRPVLELSFQRTGSEWYDGDAGGTERPGYLTDVITDIGLEWLNSLTGDNSANPFCLMLHHKAPHQPYYYPEKYRALYRDDLPEPETFQDDYSSRLVLQRSQARWSKLENMVEGDLAGDELGDCAIPSRHDKHAFRRFAYQTVFKGYLRLVAALDDSVGRVLDYLDQTGLSDNTLVVYTSDNGYFLGDHGLYNKMWMYEDSLRLPLLMRLPGFIQSGRVCDDFISLLDFAPTFCDLASAPADNPSFQGQSITPLFTSKTPTDWRDAHYYHYYGDYDVPSHCGIRTRDAKLIYYYENSDPEEQWELFDLRKDPGELSNLALSPTSENTNLLGNMRRLLHKYAQHHSDPVAEKVTIT